MDFAEGIEFLPIQQELETKPVLKAVAKAHRALAELKGVVRLIPNEDILVNSLTLYEAKKSSEIENIVTTHDELFRAEIMLGDEINAATKEVKNYELALKEGFRLVKDTGIITYNTILKLQAILENNQAGIRSLPGTSLKNSKTGEVIYTPPQEKVAIESLLDNLLKYINTSMDDCDPLVRMAVIHHQFESIHPFYEGMKVMDVRVGS